MNRKCNINRLKTETFDVCIIGAGASGAGCALDAQLRGLKVAIIEADDFAAKTSSQSTKLIHGGVRYLEQAFKKLDFAQLRQVKHGLEERATLLRIAPHLARPLALLTPCYSWIEGLYYAVGLRIYGWFARNDVMPKSQWLNRKLTFAKIPNLHPNIQSSILYYDAQFDDARLCLSIIKTAAHQGAVVANHLKLIQFETNKSGKIAAAIVEDVLENQEFRINSAHFINCTGAAADSIRLKANPALSARIQKSKGSHILLPLSYLGDISTALLIPKTKDDRVVFAIPWENQLLVGTTDTPYVTSDFEPKINQQEVTFLIETLNRYLLRQVEPTAVKAGFAGLRPLIQAVGKSTKQLLRDHVVEYDEVSGLLTLMGGKWTTYRLMAKHTIDELCKLMDRNIACNTEHQLMIEAVQYDFNTWRTLAQKYNIAPDIAQHLLQKYGSLADKLLSNGVALLHRLHPNYPYIWAEVKWQIEEEMACSIEDILCRRMRIAFLDWAVAKAIARQVADILADYFEWTEVIKEEKVTHFISSLVIEKTNS
jgi:glycerol-3-phosphate dehydrogenase